MNGRWAIAGCVMMAACAAGCGYSTHSTLDAQYQTIAVPAFKNLSREYDLQAPLTNAVIRKFMADSRLEVTPLDKADLILEGVILDYDRKGLTYDSDDEVTQFLCFVTAGARLTDARTGKVLWEDDQRVGETTFSTRAAGQGRLKQQVAASEDLAGAIKTVQEQQVNLQSAIGRLNSTMNSLASTQSAQEARIKDNEQWVQSNIEFRKQVTQRLTRLENPPSALPPP